MTKFCCPLVLAVLSVAAAAQINLSQGQPIGVGASSALVSTNNERVCDPSIGFSGSDTALQIQTCINALGAVPSGAVDARGFTGTSLATVSNSIVPASLSPKAVKVYLGGVTITTNVPQLLQSHVELIGTGAQGSSGSGMTFFVAGSNFPAACGANDTTTPTCTCSTTNAISTSGTNVGISGTNTKWSTGSVAQILQPGCMIAIGTFNADGSIASGAWGIVEAGSAVTDTSITIGNLTKVGSGSGANAAYAKYCDLIVTSDGYTGGNPAFGVGVDHIGADCNGVDGCNAYGNYYSQEKSYLHFFQCRGYHFCDMQRGLSRTLLDRFLRQGFYRCQSGLCYKRQCHKQWYGFLSKRRSTPCERAE